VALNPRVVVPGHGPLCDTRGINAVRDYLLFIEKEARGRFDAGKLACVYYSVYYACV
jgi:cyclase